MEAKLIRDDTLDVTQFFEGGNKAESTRRLKAALAGRRAYPGPKEREEFMKGARELREEIIGMAVHLSILRKIVRMERVSHECQIYRRG